MPGLGGPMQEAPNTTERTFTVLLRDTEPPHAEHVTLLVGEFGPTPDHPTTERTLTRLVEAAAKSGLEVVTLTVNLNDADDAVPGVEA